MVKRSEFMEFNTPLKGRNFVYKLSYNACWLMTRVFFKFCRPLLIGGIVCLLCKTFGKNISWSLICFCFLYSALCFAVCFGAEMIRFFSSIVKNEDGGADRLWLLRYELDKAFLFKSGKFASSLGKE